MKSIVVLTLATLSIAWAGIAVVFGIIPVGPGLLNRLGGVAAGDFMFFYASGLLAAQGRASDLYDPAALTAAGRQTLGAVPELVWPYPPTLSVPLSWLGHLAPPVALCVWVGIGTLCILLTGRLAFSQWRYAPIALLFPAAAFALFAGQLSPLLALMLALVITKGDTQPTLGGIALGLLAWKPHLAIAPSLLTGRAQTRLFGAVTVFLLVVLSFVVYGADPWLAFLRGGLRHSAVIVAETPFSRFVTIFAAAHTQGLSVGLAFVTHAVLAVAGCWAGYLLWRSSAPQSIRAFGFVRTVFPLSPYALDYDLVLFLLPWLLMMREACFQPALARRLFWPWTFLTILLPVAYLISIYTGHSYAGPLLLISLVVLASNERQHADHALSSQR